MRFCRVWVRAAGALARLTADDARLSPIVEACARHGVHCFVGAVTAAESPSRPLLSNAVMHIAADGSRNEEYRKMHLWGEERSVFVAAGADLLLFASAFAEGEEEHRYDVYHVARALESGVWVAVSNALGSVRGTRFFGRGAIVDPRGTIVTEHNDASGIIWADIDRRMITEMRRVLPYLSDLRKEYVPSQRHGS